VTGEAPEQPPLSPHESFCVRFEVPTKHK